MKARLLGGLGEGAVTVVEIEVGLSSLEVGGWTVGPTNTGQPVVERRIDLARPADVIADEEIEISIVVAIKKTRAAAPGRIPSCHTGGGGDVLKPPAEISEQAILIDRRDEEVGLAVVVIITDRGAHSVDRHGQAADYGNILEETLPVIRIEPQGRHVLPRSISRPGHTVHQEKILVLVLIEIKEGAARPHGLGKKLLARGPVEVNEVDPGGRGYVAEGHRRSPGAHILGQRQYDRLLIDLILHLFGPKEEEDHGDERQDRGQRESGNLQRPEDDGVIAGHELAFKRFFSFVIFAHPGSVASSPDGPYLPPPSLFNS